MHRVLNPPHDIQKHLIIRLLLFFFLTQQTMRPAPAASSHAGVGRALAPVSCCWRLLPVPCAAPLCRRVRHLCAAPFPIPSCPLVCSASFPSAPCFSSTFSSSLPPARGWEEGRQRSGRGCTTRAAVQGISPGELGSASLPLLLSNLILPCFIAGPLSSVTGKSFQCPGSLLQRQRGRGCSF